MRYDLPEYVLNKSLLTAIRRNNSCYVAATIAANPCILDALLYTKSDVEGFGIFEQSYQKPLTFLLTPIAYAILHDSHKVINLLISLGANVYHPCYTLDILQEDRQTPIYRVHELPPIALCSPEYPGFVTAVKAGYDIHRPITVLVKVHHPDMVEESNLSYRGFWDFCLGIPKLMKTPSQLNNLTDIILHNGYDCNILIRQIDLLKLFARYYGLVLGEGFDNQNNAQLAIELLEVLIQNGCCLKRKQVGENICRVVEELLIHIEQYEKEVSDKFYRILVAFMRISQHFVNIIDSDEVIWQNALEAAQINSLTVLCLRRLRSFLGSRMFSRQVNKLNCPFTLKQFIMTGKDIPVPSGQLTKLMEPNIRQFSEN